MKASASFCNGDDHVHVATGRKPADAIDPARLDVEVVRLGKARVRIPEAEAAGVKSVPALVKGGQPFHINFGAAVADLK